MTTMEVKEFIKKLKEKNDIWDEQMVIDVFGNKTDPLVISNGNTFNSSTIIIPPYNKRRKLY